MRLTHLPAILGGLATVCGLSAVAAADAARGTRGPNLLVAVADDWSCGHAGAYGCRWVKTPAFDRVARQGLLFTHAYTPNGKCAPSRAAMLTGRNPWQLEAAANHWCYFPPQFKSYPEALAEHGYTVGYTGKGWGPGVARTADGGPRDLLVKAFSRRKATPPTTAISPNDYAANFAEFLDQADPQRPWCFWYGGHEPHRPYAYGSGAALGGKHAAEIERVPGCWPDNQTVRNDMLDYAFEVEHFDRHLGRMLDLLQQRGLLEHTLVLVTSDNGMPFPHDKGNAYQDTCHLPLAVMWPGVIVRPGRVVDDYVSFVDIAPTLVAAAGLDWPQTGMAPTAGRGLQDVFAAAAPGRCNPARDHVLVGRERNDVGRPGDAGYPIRGIVRDDVLYLHNFQPGRWPCCDPETGYLDTDGGPTKTEVLKTRRVPDLRHYWTTCFGKRPADELYDLRQDPDCVVNLAAQRDFQPLRQQLFAELQAQHDPRVLGQGAAFDAYPTADDQVRHFYERFQKGEKLCAGWVSPSDFEKDVDEKGAAEQ